jgi:hypothetical protein
MDWGSTMKMEIGIQGEIDWGSTMEMDIGIHKGNGLGIHNEN